MAAWATVVLRCVNQSSPPSGLARQSKEVTRKLLDKNSWKLSDKTAMKDLHDIVALLDEHRLKDTSCLAYLIKLATSSAKHIEEQMEILRDKEWKRHVAG